MVIDDNNFENQYWNLIQVLAWIYSKTSDTSLDDALVKIREETFKRKPPTNSEIEKSITQEPVRSDVALFAGGITLVDMDYDKRLGETLKPLTTDKSGEKDKEFKKQLKAKIGDPNWFDDIENELIRALQNGGITCYGLEEDDGSSQPIPDIHWIDLCFWYESPLILAGPKEYYRSGTRWYGLKFLAKSIKKIWSTPPVASTVPDETACQSWLEGLMANNSTQDEAKKFYQDEAKQKYNVGTKAFNRAWANAITAIGNTNWGKPGRRKS